MENFIKKIKLDLGNPKFQILLHYFTYVTNYHVTIDHLKGTTQVGSDNLGKADLLLEPVIVPSISGAILISMYGDFEFYLNKLCDAFKEIKQLNISFGDIAGTGITRSVTYLEKIVGIKGIKQTKEWSKMKDWSVIRNALVHRNGILHEKETDAAKRLGLSFNKDFLEAEIMKLNLSLENCTEFATCSGNFFTICIRDNE